MTTGLRFTREGANVRATTASGAGFLFLNRDPAEVEQAFEQAVSSARGHFEPRYAALGATKLSRADFLAFTEEAALAFLYLAFMHGASLEADAREWEHPQTRRIVERWVERRYRARTEEQARIAAILFGLTPELYASYREGQRRFEDR